jgi:hypothetical protein
MMKFDRSILGDMQAKKTGPKAGFLCSLPKITWREQREQREQREPEQQRQRARRRERQRQQERQGPEQREPEQREPEQLQQREQEQRVLFCRKQTGTEPAGRRAGRYISFV